MDYTKLSQSIYQQEKSLTLKEQNRVVIRKRFCNAFRELFLHPWKVVFPLMILALFGFLFSKRALIPYPGSVNIPFLEEIYAYVATALIVTISILALLVTLLIIGTPFHAKKIEHRLTRAGVIDRYGLGPALVACRREKQGNIRIMTFYSCGISKEKWQMMQHDIENILNVHFVEEPHYGGKRRNNGNYIVITVAPGAEGLRRETPLYDDEL